MKAIHPSLYVLDFTKTQWKLESCISNPPMIFFMACCFELYAMLNDLLSADLDIINARNQKGQSGLHLAFYSHNYKAAKLLLDKGAAVDAFCHKGESTIDALLNTGDIDMLKLLLTYNVDINMDNAVRTLFKPQHDTRESAREMFRFLLENYACPFNTKALEYVTEAADTEIVRLVLEHNQHVRVDLVVLNAAVENEDLSGEIFEILINHYTENIIPASILETAIIRGKIGHVRALTFWNGNLNLSTDAIEKIGWCKHYSVTDINLIVEMLLNRFGKLPITSEIVNAASRARMEESGAELVRLLLTQPAEITVSNDTVEEILDRYAGDILPLLLARLGDDQKTAAVLQSVFLGSPLDLQKSMLDGKVIHITEQILEAMAAQSNEEQWKMVLEHLGEIVVTEKQLLEAADRGYAKVFELLLEQPRAFQISSAILNAAVHPTKYRNDVDNVPYVKTMLLLNQPDAIAISVTEDIVIAAATGSPEVLRLLVEVFNDIPVTDKVLEAVILLGESNSEYRELLQIMFSVRTAPKVSLRVLKQAAQSCSGGAMDLLLKLDQDIEIASEILLAAARNHYDAAWRRLLRHSRDLPLNEGIVIEFMAKATPDSTALLLNRHENVQITDNILKAAAKGYPVNSTRVTRLLLQKQPNAENLEDVLATVAECGDSELLRLYLEHFKDITVSEAVLIGACKNVYGQQILVVLTPWIKKLEITEDIREAALSNPSWPRRCEEIMLYLLQLRQRDLLLSDSDKELLYHLETAKGLGNRRSSSNLSSEWGQ
jgi:hypothetical protein